MTGSCGRDRRWNIRVTDADDAMLHEVMESTARRTGEYVTQTGTLRRAVYELYDRECGLCSTDEG